jgi:hypothetical protein
MSESKSPLPDRADPPFELEGPPNGLAAPDSNGQADVASPDSSLKSRIDPADILVDWDTGLTDEEDSGLGAKWGKPPKDNFVRAHPTWSAGAYYLDCTDSSGLGAEYLLSRPVARRLEEEDEPAVAVKIFLLINRDGGFIFWAVKLGDLTAQQKPSEYVKSALQAVEAARQKWVKIRWQSRRSINGYRTRAAQVEIPDPTWPGDIENLFLEAVSDRFISDPADKVIQRFLGEA